MEKTLTININGWVFNINEDAYEKLTEYFKNLNGYFKKQDGGDEIVADIEARIAELFRDLTKDKENLVSIKEVEEVINIMGEPYQMDDADDASYEPRTDNKKFKRKLFRDPLNAHIAGVASGLGKYIKLDPIIIRIIFIVLIPSGGLGIILYAVLWILIPEAATTSDRIKMEGKKVNVENIENKVREETEYLKTKLNDFSEEAKDAYHRSQPIRKLGIQKLEASFRVLGKIVVRILKFLLGLILLLTGIGFLITFAIFFFNWVPSLEFDSFFVNGLSLPAFLDSFILDTKYSLIAVIAIVILLLIPIVMLIFNGIRFLFNLKRKKLVGNIAWQGWLVALIVSLGLSYGSIRSFKSDAIQITSHRFDQLQSDTLSINLNTVGYYQDIVSSDNHVISQDDQYLLLQDGLFYGVPSLEILSTDKPDFEMKLYSSASGKDEDEAYKNIQGFNYLFKKDSMGILLDPYFKLDDYSFYRNQDLKIKIYIPEGKSICLDKRIRKHFRLRYFWKGRLNSCKEEKCYWTVVNKKFMSAAKEKLEPMMITTDIQYDTADMQQLDSSRRQPLK
jgi:phage shock protein PspC (stress-responsive transcriptional regulator)